VQSPRLLDLVPTIVGAVYSHSGTTYLAPDEGYEDTNPKHGIVRCGFKLYELGEWNAEQRVWVVREFKATLNKRELMVLSEQARA
jgi:hypothetical protein